MPRMARIKKKKKFDELKNVYLHATQFISVIAVTAGIVLAALAEPVLYVWTGDVELAKKAAPILQLYSLGNALLALAAFPYYLQYAKGSLKYHFIGNFVGVICLVPAIIWAAKNYGAIVAGWAWVLIQLTYLLLWVSYVHKMIEPEINLQWFKSFLPSIFCVSIVSYTIVHFMNLSEQRYIAFLQIFAISLLCLIVAVISSKQARSIIQSRVLKRFL